ncbi:MAG: GNAT family N-acetyltransferase [Planctomycetota bacterium]|nr:GNAT family N-acetyltransferase [Planctomycetota bacterium]
MNVRIRAASPDDVLVISEFNCCLAIETENKTLNRSTVLEGVRRGLELGDEVQYFVAEDESGVIGQIMLTREWSDWRNGWMIWLQSVYVLPARRGAGVFRMLFERSIELAGLRCNAVCVRLYVEHENATATATYRRLGFLDSGYLVMELPLDSRRR